MEETTHVMEPPEESLTQRLEYHEMTIPIPTQDQAKYPSSLTVSFQPLDLELPLTSEPTRESAFFSSIAPSASKPYRRHSSAFGSGTLHNLYNYC